LAKWARNQVGVVRAAAERPTVDGTRRSDVEVVFGEGARVVIEVQLRTVHDDDWRKRHNDYVRNGIVDVWIWHRNVATPWVAVEQGLPLWFLHLEKRELGTMVGRPHQRIRDWYRSEDPSVFSEHVPPCVGDGTAYHVWSLDLLTLSPSGLQLPS